MTPLTDRQKDVLDAIQAFIAAHGYAPTSQEIADQLGMAKAAAHGHVRALEAKGAIRRAAGRARSIVVLPLSPPAASEEPSQC